MAGGREESVLCSFVILCTPFAFNYNSEVLFRMAGLKKGLNNQRRQMKGVGVSGGGAGKVGNPAVLNSAS